MSSDNAIEGLEPSLVWEYFATLSSIPRCSKHEERIARYVCDVATRLGLDFAQDAVGNVMVRKPAAAGREHVPGICLQGHLDMVCEKDPLKVHDFSRDGISLIRRDGFIVADGTTLGADNGIAVATNLALMEASELTHGPLEFLFTVDEETGLTGAKHLQPGFVQSRMLLNLDSEEEGELYVGCAGGCDTIGSWPIERESAAADALDFEVTVTGLTGGHSGVDIEKGRGNAIKILNRIVARLGERGARLARIDGGKLRNVIPYHADALLFVPRSMVDEAQHLVSEMHDVVRRELGSVEPNVSITSAVGHVRQQGSRDERPDVFTSPLQRRVTAVISALPHGIIRLSPDMPGLVETSSNVAVVETAADRVTLATSQRSSIASALTEAANTVRSVFTLGDAAVETTDAYPGWKPDLRSPLLTLARHTYQQTFGIDPKVKSIHAGLECGVIGERYQGIDMVSFGPTMIDVHSAKERLEIASVERFWRFLCAVLAALE